MSGNDRRGFGRLPAALAGLVAGFVGLTGAVRAEPQSLSPAAAPAEWVAYAEAATRTVTAWLEAEDEAAVRMRAYLEETRPAPDQPTDPLLLKVWVAGDGRVERLEFTPFAHEQQNADLRGSIVGRRLAPPPRGMLLPLRLSIQLDPAPPE